MKMYMRIIGEHDEQELQEMTEIRFRDGRTSITVRIHQGALTIRDIMGYHLLVQPVAANVVKIYSAINVTVPEDAGAA